MKRDGSIHVPKGKEGQPTTAAWFGRTVIRSCCRLDYSTAYRMVDGSITAADAASGVVDAALWPLIYRPDAQSGATLLDVWRDVNAFNGIARARRKRRFSSGGGALRLDQKKLCFDRDADGNPTRVFTYEIKESNQLVEEFMLMANYLVAQRLIMRAGKRALIRKHDPPKEAKFARFLDFCRRHFRGLLGGDVGAGSAGQLHA